MNLVNLLAGLAGLAIAFAAMGLLLVIGGQIMFRLSELYDRVALGRSSRAARRHPDL